MEKKYNLIFAGCYYAFFVNGILALMLGSIMPMLLLDFNLGYDQGGMLLSSHSIGNLIASFLSGIIPIYLGRRNSIVMLSAMTALGFGGMLIAKSPTVLMVMFLLTGIGRGSVTNTNNSIVNDVAHGNPGPMNILHTFFAVGAFISPFLASWCISWGLGWKYAAGTVAVLGIIMIIVFATMKIENSRSNKNAKSDDQKVNFDFLKNIDFYIASGILFFYLGIETSVNGWIVTYLKDTGIMSTSMAQTVLSILWIVIIFGRLFCAYISKVVDKKTILLTSSAGVVLFFALFIMSSNIWAIIACMVGLGFCLAGIYPTTISNVGGVIKGSGLAMGILLSVAGLGGILMPYITGAVAERTGIAGGMAVISVFAIMLFLFALANKFRKLQY
jgi:fucose permease